MHGSKARSATEGESISTDGASPLITKDEQSLSHGAAESTTTATAIATEKQHISKVLPEPKRRNGRILGAVHWRKSFFYCKETL